MPRAPICLRWATTMGNWRMWVFSWNQENSMQSGAAVLFQEYIEDLESATTDSNKVSQINIPKMNLGADNLNGNDFGFVSSILNSIKVQVLMNPDSWQTDGPKWQTVIVQTGTIPMGNTRSENNDLEITIEFPQIFLQRQ